MQAIRESAIQKRKRRKPSFWNFATTARWLFNSCMAVGIPCSFFPAHAAGQDTLWNNINGGSFYTASNWTNGIPLPNYHAQFGAFTSSDSYNILFSSSANNLRTDIRVGGINFLLNGSTYSLFELNLDASGRLIVRDGTLVSENVNVNSGGGALVIEHGGRMEARDIRLHDAFLGVQNGGQLVTDSLDVGVGTGVAVILDDLGSSISVNNNLVIGASAPFATSSFLQSTNGTTLTTRGTVTVTGNSNNSGQLNIGGIWNHQGGAVSLAPSGGSGQIFISGGQSIWDGPDSIATLFGNSNLSLSDNGSLEIRGAGLGNGIRLNGTSLMNVNGGTVNISSTGLRAGIEIGNTATLRIDNGGQVITSRLFNALGTIDIRSGSLAIDGGIFEPGLATLNLGGTQDVAVELRNGATSDLIPGLVIGSTATSFRNRQMNVLSGSTLNTLGTGVIGQLGDGSLLRVSGADSLWSHQGAITLGTAEGSLVVENGGRVDSHGNNLSSGIAGTGGDATLIVRNGGRIDTGVIELSRAGGSATVATISGAGTIVNSTGLFVGGSATAEGGTASLNVSDGAVVNVAGTLRARNLGTINIDGGSVTTQNLTRSTTGTLNFTDGELNVLGFFSNNGGNITLAGNAIDDNPRLTLTGAASTAGTTNLNVGTTNRQGELTVESGAQLLTGALAIGNAGKAVLNGGRLLISSFSNTGTFQWNGGSVDFQSSVVLDNTTLNGLVGSSHSLGANQSLGSIGGTMTVDSFLNVDGGTLAPANLTNNSTLSVNQGQVVTGTLINNAGRTLLVNGNSVVTGNNAFQNSGTIRMNSPTATISGRPLNNLAGGIIGGTGQVHNDLINEGTVRVTGGEHLVFSGSDNTNAMNVNLAGGTLEFTRSLTNREGGAITGRGTLITSSGSPGGTGLVNDGLISFSAGMSDVYGDVEQLSSGRIVTSGNAITTFFDDVVHNGQEIRTFLGSTTVFLGEQTGSGNFTGTGVVEYAGDLRPGNSPASISYEGDVLFNSSVRSFFELGGLATGEFDQLLIDGDFHVDGSLLVDMINGHTLGAGDFYLIGEVGGFLTGGFNNLGEGELVGNFGGRDLFITYAGGNGNDIGLFTAVPEPSVVLVIIVLAGCCFVNRRVRNHPTSA